jgi:23S rRNA (uracil1939-C5)-methyltransferase
MEFSVMEEKRTTKTQRHKAFFILLCVFVVFSYSIYYQFQVKLNFMIIGDEIEVSVEKLIYGGAGLARTEERVIFVPGAAPGDRLRVRITSVEKRHLEAEIVAILEPSPSRRAAPCKYFGDCGGCQIQHLDYKAQLSTKAEFIRDSLARIGHIKWPMPIEVKHGPELGYRSRAQFKIDRAAEPLKIGYYRAGSQDVCDVEVCPILSPDLNEALGRLRSARSEIASSDLPYSKIEVVAGENRVAALPAVADLRTEAVERSVLGIKYRYDPECFFQVNHLMLETLVEAVIGERTGKLAIDLYAGVGLFALQLARRYRRVMATEVSKRAASRAGHNIRLNQMENLEFSDLSAERWLSTMLPRGKRDKKPKIEGVDLVVLDPPRAGASGKVLAELINLKPAEIVYVSCDPSTLARDLRILIDAGFDLQSVIGVDLFPQSYHIETVASLKRGGETTKTQRHKE